MLLLAVLIFCDDGDDRKRRVVQIDALNGLNAALMFQKKSWSSSYFIVSMENGYYRAHQEGDKSP